MSLIRGGRCEQLSYQTGSKAFQCLPVQPQCADSWRVGGKKVYLQDNMHLCVLRQKQHPKQADPLQRDI